MFCVKRTQSLSNTYLFPSLILPFLHPPLACSVRRQSQAHDVPKNIEQKLGSLACYFCLKNVCNMSLFKNINSKWKYQHFHFWVIAHWKILILHPLVQFFCSKFQINFTNTSWHKHIIDNVIAKYELYSDKSTVSLHKNFLFAVLSTDTTRLRTLHVWCDLTRAQLFWGLWQ